MIPLVHSVLTKLADRLICLVNGPEVPGEDDTERLLQALAFITTLHKASGVLFALLLLFTTATYLKVDRMQVTNMDEPMDIEQGLGTGAVRNEMNLHQSSDAVLDKTLPLPLSDGRIQYLDM